jgi:hypothetical protein
MSSEYAVARRNLALLGLDGNEVERPIIDAKDIVKYAMFDKRDGLFTAYRSLNRFLGDHVGDVKTFYNRALNFDQGFDAINELSKPGTVVGLTGKPVSGKSTFLNYLSENSNILVVDEFWDAQEGYQKKIDIVRKMKKKGARLIVAASQLEDDLVDLKFHLVTSPVSRKHNLQIRSRGITDQLRAKYFTEFNVADDLVYELEILKAQHVIDSSRIRY